MSDVQGFIGLGRVTQNAAPATGATVVIPDGPSDVLLWLVPAGALATLSVTLPTDTGSFIGQEVSIGASKTVTVLTVTGATTIYNAATILNPGDLFTLKKVGTNVWARKE